jgi:hypothetical protein
VKHRQVVVDDHSLVAELLSECLWQMTLETGQHEMRETMTSGRCVLLPEMCARLQSALLLRGTLVILEILVTPVSVPIPADILHRQQ